MDKKKTEKLFKRFLKEISIFGSAESRTCINRLRTHNDYYMPFNFFRWELTKQGHMYWFNNSVDWCFFLCDNIGDIENKEVERKQIAKTVHELFAFYIPLDYWNKYKETLAYKDVIKRLEDIEGKID